MSIDTINKYKYIILLIIILYINIKYSDIINIKLLKIYLVYLYVRYIKSFIIDNTIPKFIASKSFIYLCDHYTPSPKSESIDIPDTYPNKDGDKIYIHNTALNNFVNNYLPNIKYRFILLSGDCDKTIPEDYEKEVNIILNNPFLITWYSQNCTIVLDKLKQLPIGLDYHTLVNSSTSWGNQQSVIEQENDLTMIKNMNISKINKCYANFYFNIKFANFARYGYDRADAYSQIQRDLVFYEPNILKRINTWKNMTKYKYVISPMGQGMDCHRTWEAIILGCIPIVKTSPLDTLFNGLPILIVKNWSDITQDLLDSYTPDYSNIDKITFEYWKNKLKY
jgi:hypothetical protein